jgi:predicted permease
MFNLRALFHKKRSEQEMDDEMRFHLERQTEQNIARGMSPKDARFAALRQFGNMGQIKEKCRDGWGVRFVNELAQDLRYGLRQLRRNPGFTAVAILTLALGIGANTAMFSVINAVLLTPLPYRSPNQLAMLWTQDLSQNVREGRAAFWSVEQWRQQSRTFAQMAVFDPASVTLTGGDRAERIGVAQVSPNFFQLLGIQPVVGRVFSRRESEQRQRLVLISHRFWQTHFGGSQIAIGSTLEIDAVPYRVIGVLPAGFTFLRNNPDIWEPETLSPDFDVASTSRAQGPWFVIGRLRAGVTFGQAQAEMDAIARRLSNRLPATERNLGIRVVPLSLQLTGSRLRVALWMLTGAVFFVLLIAVANVAGLLLARSASREREIAIRAALGASCPRIVRQLLAESVTLAFLSGVLGLLVAWLGVRLILLLQPGNLPGLKQISLDPRVLGWTLVLCLFTGIFLGLSPAITMVRGKSPTAWRGGSRGATETSAARGIRRVLVATEFALAIVLLVGAGLLIRSLWSVENVSPGFSPEQVLSLQLCLPARMTNAQRINFYNQALSRIQGLAGVKSAGLIENLFITSEQEQTITVEGNAQKAATRLQFRNDAVSGKFFRTLETPLLKGRFFNAEDGPDSPRVAIINQEMAHRLWGGLDPVGNRFKRGAGNTPDAWLTVVGVVGNMRRQGFEHQPIPQMFVPLAQDPSHLITLLIRTSGGDPLKLLGTVQATIQQVDKLVPVYSAASMESQLGVFLKPRRFQTSLLILFSAVALLMVAIGIFGLVQYSVAQRTHEIGIRMALGAQKHDVVGMIIRQGLNLLLVGLIIGLAGALALTRFLSSLLYGVKPTDPLTFIAVSLILTGVALLACYIPARRAAKVDPMVALRYE